MTYFEAVKALAPFLLLHSCGRFVQRPNWVDLEAGEAALRSAGRYSELVALYQVGHSVGLSHFWL